MVAETTERKQRYEIDKFLQLGHQNFKQLDMIIVFKLLGIVGGLDSRTSQTVCSGRRAAGNRAGNSFQDPRTDEGGGSYKA